MQKVKFATGRYEQLVGYVAGIPCVPGGSASRLRAGETWLVEITGSNTSRTVAYVRAVRPWQGTPEDHRAVVHAHVDFRDGTLKFRGRFAFPLKHTVYAQMWEDYRVLAEDMHAVIIRGDKAVRWTRKGKPPQVLPLQRFATKYKRQRLLGEPGDVDYFLANVEALRAQTIEEARARDAKVGQDAVRA